MTTLSIGRAAAPRIVPPREEFPWGQMHVERATKLTISPETFAFILAERNVRNRPMKQASIQRYSQALREGRWVVNGETIVFGWDGQLLDGQNRAAASVETGLPLTSWVVFGIDPAAFFSMGKGKSRSVADDFAIDGDKNTAVMAAIASALHLDDLGKAELIGVSVEAHLVRATRLRYPDLPAAASFAASHKARMILVGRVVGFLYLRLIRAGKDPADVVRFFDDLASGANLAADDPVLYLREKLRENRGSRTMRLTPAMSLAMAIKAWNCREMGKGVQRNAANLIWRPGCGEAFPRIIGVPATVRGPAAP